MRFKKRNGNRSSVRLFISPGCIAVLLLMFARLMAWSQQPDSSTTQNIPHANTPKQVALGTLKSIQPYDPASKLRLAISIKAPKMAEEEKFLNQLQDKTSPNYHKWLTPEQWNARFAPAAQDEQSVVDWATSQGLTITARYPNRLMVNVEGTVDTIQKAFNIKINHYQVNGAVEFSNDRDPQIPANLQGIVQFVDGLNSIMRMRPANRTMKGVRGPDYAPGAMHQIGESVHMNADSAAAQALNTAAGQVGSQVTNGFYDPTDFWSQRGYNYNALQGLGHCCNPLHNAGQTPPETTIGLATDGDFADSDMVGFHNQYPYLAYHYNRVFVNGTPGGGDDETTLDLEWTTATSNSQGSYVDTSFIWVYEAAQGFGDFGTLFQQMVNDNFVRVVNISYGLSETVFLDNAPSLLTSWHAIFNQMIGQGWTIMASSGDSGSDAGCTGSLAVLYPESDPNITSVGGSQLEFNPDGSFNTEVAWSGDTFAGACSGNDGGGGGGCSAVWSAPSYQVNPYCGSSSRSVPDISLHSSPHPWTNFFFGGSLDGIAGTSLASPMMSGFIAQENAYSLSMGNACGSGTHNCAPIGLVNKDIYAEGGYNMSAPHYPFYDITSGCTSNDTISSAWCAASGYDLATGWGSFNALQMAWAINWEDNLAYSAPSVVYSGPAKNTWYNSNQVVSWSINANGNPTGVAGFTQGWDSIPSDPFNDTNRNDSNSFFSGPQFPNATTGCVDFTGGAGCAGGVSQGCHTAHVRAWSNQGSTSGDTTYGPICYDTVAPTVTASDSPAPNTGGYNNTSVKITLTATDATSGVLHTYYAVDTTACTPSTLGSCAVYPGPLTISATGTHYVEYFTEDVAGNFSGESIDYVYIDEVAPVTASALSGVLSGSAYTTPVKVTLSASDNYSGVASTIYSVDGGAGIPYSAPFTVTGVGSHTIHYRSTDRAGNTEVTEIKTFTISALPALTLSATHVAFGNQIVGTSSGLQTVTVTNSGSGTLSFTSIVLGGANANQFSTSNTCGNLAGGASCTIRLRFNPTVKQADTAAITLTDNASGSPQTVSITGTGVTPPTATLSATHIAFGNEAVGTSSALQTVTVTNSGGASLTLTSIVLGGTNANQFATSNNCGSSLAGGTSCTIRLRFNPTVTGADTASITLTDNATGSPQTVSLTGTGVTPPTATLSATHVAFGNQAVGTSSALQTVTVTNNGTATLIFTSITIGGANANQFSTSNNCGNLAGGASCTIRLRFNPTVKQADTAAITITDNASGSPQTVSLTGTGN